MKFIPISMSNTPNIIYFIYRGFNQKYLTKNKGFNKREKI